PLPVREIRLRPHQAFVHFGTDLRAGPSDGPNAELVHLAAEILGAESAEFDRPEAGVAEHVIRAAGREDTVIIDRLDFRFRIERAGPMMPARVSVSSRSVEDRIR